jgi:hypothetical protein
MKTEEVLGHLPETLREELVDEFNKIVTNYREGKWEPSEMAIGKMCEIVYSILRGHVDGSFPARSSKPNDMVTACRAFEQAGPSFPRTVRIQIPRILVALYEVRNNRGVGHVGGDVNPNHMDATFVLYSSKWLMAELVRLFHSVDTATATEAVEVLVEREVPIIWKVNGKKRVLDGSLSMKEKTLLLLYSEPRSVTEAKLVEWTEHSNVAVYRRDVLVKFHKDKKEKLWEYDKRTREITLSPIGTKYVETKLL